MRLYGEFLTRFEFVCSRVRFAIWYLIYEDYDHSKRNVCEIITEGRTADPLRKKFLGLIVERFSKPSNMYKSADLFSRQFSEITELRNSFAHGTPFLGQYDFIEETKRGRLALRHTKIKSDGLHQYDSIAFSVPKSINFLQYLITSLILIAVTPVVWSGILLSMLSI